MGVVRPATPGSAAHVGRRAVLPDHRVEELVGLGQRRVGRPDRGGPAPGDAVGVARDPHGEAGDHEVPGHGVVERAARRAPRARTRGSARRRRRGWPPGPRRPRRLDELRRAPADQGEPGAVEEHGRAAVELQGVGPVLERHGARVERRRHGSAGPGGDHELAEAARQGSDRRRPEKPASSSIRRRTGRGRQVGHRARQVAVGLPVREGAAQGGHRLGEPDVVAGAPEPRGRGVDLEHGQAPARPEHPGRLGQRGGQVGEVAQGVAADEPVEGAVGEGEAAAVRLDQRGRGAVGGQHARAQVGARPRGSPGAARGARGHRCRRPGRGRASPRARPARPRCSRRHAWSSPNVIRRFIRS